MSLDGIQVWKEHKVMTISKTFNIDEVLESCFQISLRENTFQTFDGLNLISYFVKHW